MFGNLTWQAIPLGQPIPLAAGAFVVLFICSVLIWVWAKGYIPYLWREWITSVDHKRIGIMYCVDALAAGARVPRCRLPASGALRSDLLGARHTHDLLRGHAFCHWSDELCGSPATWGTRRGLPDIELRGLLAHGRGGPAGQPFARRRRVRPHRLAALSAAVGAHLL